MKRFQIPVACLFLCASAAAQRPTPAEQSRTVEAARTNALQYAKTLPDFICTETIERTGTDGDPNQSQRRGRLTTQQGDGAGIGVEKTDRLTIELTYFKQTENYKLLTINGRPTTASLESIGGLITEGEFGTLLVGVFNPASQADFRWKGWSTIRERRAAVYTYRIARAKSHFMVGYRAATGNMVSVAAGYHGEVAFELESLNVLRLTAQADDIPRESGVVKSESSVDYDIIEVAGRRYLLPAKAETHLGRIARELRSLVIFNGYKKYEADSTVVFH